MIKYEYNIRSKVCSSGFNPGDWVNTFTKLCSECNNIREKDYAEIKRVCAS